METGKGRGAHAFPLCNLVPPLKKKSALWRHHKLLFMCRLLVSKMWSTVRLMLWIQQRCNLCANVLYALEAPHAKNDYYERSSWPTWASCGHCSFLCTPSLAILILSNMVHFLSFHNSCRKPLPPLMAVLRPWLGGLTASSNNAPLSHRLPLVLICYTCTCKHYSVLMGWVGAMVLTLLCSNADNLSPLAAVMKRCIELLWATMRRDKRLEAT